MLHPLAVVCGSRSIALDPEKVARVRAELWGALMGTEVLIVAEDLGPATLALLGTERRCPRRVVYALDGSVWHQGSRGEGEAPSGARVHRWTQRAPPDPRDAAAVDTWRDHRQRVLAGHLGRRVAEGVGWWCGPT